MNSSWRTMTNHSLRAAFTDVIDSVVVRQQDDHNIVSLVLKDGRQVELIGKHVTFAKQPPTTPSVDWADSLVERPAV